MTDDKVFSRPVVLHILGAVDFGGAETSLLSQIRSSEAVTHIVFSCSGRFGSLERDYRSAGAFLFTAPIFRRPLSSVRLLREVVRAWSVSCLVSHIGLPSGLFMLLAWMLRVPRRVTVMHSEGAARAIDCRSRLSRARRVVQDAFFRFLIVVFSTTVSGVSAPALSYGLWRCSFLGRCPEAVVIPNGVDPNRFHPAADRPSGRRVIYIGRNSAVKNRSRLIGLSRALVSAGWDKISVVGPIGDDISFGEEHITILGPRHDVAELLREADVLVLVSTEEGHGLVLLEALASGVPCVSSPTGGARSIASVVPGVSLVSLDAPDDDWVTAIVASRKKFPPGVSRVLAEGIVDAGLDQPSISRRWLSVYVG